MELNKQKLEQLKQTQYNQPKELMTLEGSPKIKGFDFENDVNLDNFLNSLATTGFQATNLAEGIEITKIMQREKAKIFLTFTSNQVSCGNREIIKYLVKHKKVDVLVTSAGGVEEDIIKVLKPFVVGKFNIPGQMLFEKGINRTGNIFVPNDRYVGFEKFFIPFIFLFTFILLTIQPHKEMRILLLIFPFLYHE